MQSFDVVIIGAGAAGMMCAIETGKRGRQVVLIDHAKQVGKKILISGGGRCNFTNINVSPANYVSQNPHFCKSALARYTAHDFLALVKRYGIAFHEKKLGQLFCTASAQSIVDMLFQECKAVGAEFRLECKVHSVKKSDQFFLETSQDSYSAQSLVIATGGLSVPQTGATGFGYELAEQFGLRMVNPVPALDGFVFNEADRRYFHELAGVSLDALVTCNGMSFRENILFTHLGLSGPAALQASLYWRAGLDISVDVLPEIDTYKWLIKKRSTSGGKDMRVLLAQLLPKRFAEKFSTIYLDSRPLAEMADENLQTFCQKLHTWKITPKSTVGFAKAEVTRGGVDTAELSSQTMESKKVPGLYFIGEVVDVTGWLGGYNFQWAWSSGAAAGRNA